MTLALNTQGLQHALKLVEEAHFRLNTVWASSRPTPEAEAKYREQQGLDTYANWYLAVDTSQPEGSATRYQLPYGDFRSVHHTGVKQAKLAAERDGQTEIVNAADEILDLLDRFIAC
jgi:hypothetical protein